MGLYRIVNGVKQYIDIDAGTVKFQDGDSFQDKFDGGSLKGEKVIPALLAQTASTELTVFLLPCP